LWDGVVAGTVEDPVLDNKMCSAENSIKGRLVSPCVDKVRESYLYAYSDSTTQLFQLSNTYVYSKTRYKPEIYEDDYLSR